MIIKTRSHPPDPPPQVIEITAPRIRKLPYQHRLVESVKHEMLIIVDILIVVSITLCLRISHHLHSHVTLSTSTCHAIHIHFSCPPQWRFTPFTLTSCPICILHAMRHLTPCYPYRQPTLSMFTLSAFASRAINVRISRYPHSHFTLSTHTHTHIARYPYSHLTVSTFTCHAIRIRISHHPRSQGIRGQRVRW